MDTNTPTFQSSSHPLDVYYEYGFGFIPTKDDKSPATPGDWRLSENHITLEQAKARQAAGLFIGAIIPENVNIVDIDAHAGQANGFETIKPIAAQFCFDPEFPDTMSVKTKNNGRHKFFTTDQDFRQGSKAPGIDLKTCKGYVIPAGCPGYELENDFEPQPMSEQIEMWLYSCESPQNILIKQNETLDNILPPSEVQEIRSALSYMPSDDRDTWIKVGMALKSTNSPTAFGLWLEWSQKSDKHKPDDAKRWKTLKPKDVTIATVFYEAQKYGWKSTYDKTVSFPAEVGNKISDKFVMQCLYGQDLGDAELFLRVFADRFLYIAEKKKFYQRLLGIWEETSNEVERLIMTRLFSYYLKLTKAQNSKIEKLISEIDPDAVTSDVTDTIKKIEDIIKALHKRAVALRTFGKVKNIASTVAVLSTVSISEFDANKLELNLPNGVLNFSSMEFRNHNKKDKYLMQAGPEYKPGAECPQFIIFLNEIFQGDQELIEFIQKLMGLFLTGETIQFFIFFYGAGQNGKSALIMALRLLLGMYAQTIPAESLLLKNNGNSETYSMATLLGKRLAISAEMPSGKKLNIGLIKDITGGEEMTVRQIYCEPITFQPTFKLLLCGNHLPSIDDSDYGSLRRPCVIPFHYRVPKNKIIPMEILKSKFEAELPGILNFAVEGYRKYKAEGLEFPAACAMETEAYKQDQDGLSDFLDEMTTSNTGGSIVVSDFLTAYREYSEKTGIRGKFYNSRSFIAVLERRGFEIKRGGTGNKTYILGISLKNGAES